MCSPLGVSPPNNYFFAHLHVSLVTECHQHILDTQHRITQASSTTTSIARVTVAASVARLGRRFGPIWQHWLRTRTRGRAESRLTYSQLLTEDRPLA